MWGFFFFFHKILFLPFVKPLVHLAVIQVGWKARRCTWSLRTSSTTRSSQHAAPLLPANRTDRAAQGSLPPARARRTRERWRTEVREGNSFHWGFYLIVLIMALLKWSDFFFFWNLINHNKSWLITYCSALGEAGLTQVCCHLLHNIFIALIWPIYSGEYLVTAWLFVFKLSFLLVLLFRVKIIFKFFLLKH